MRAVVAVVAPLALLACAEGLGTDHGPSSVDDGPETGDLDGGTISVEGGPVPHPSPDAATADAHTTHDAESVDAARSDAGSMPDGDADAASPDGGDGDPDAAPPCPSGTVRCNDDAACVDTTDDPLNCGGCGVACPAGPPNSQPTCAQSTCGFACVGGYNECGGSSCLGAVPDAAGLFVAPGGVTAGCGTATAPCGTISAALAILRGGSDAPATVYVAESATPYVEQIELVPGVTVQGGWVYAGGTWSHPCALDPTQVVVQAPPGVDRTVVTVEGMSTLDTLTVSTSGGTTSGNTYGIFATGGATELTLTNVVVTVSGGSSGLPGSAGAPAAPAPTTGTCGTYDGANGAPGAAGQAGANGAYDVSGFSAGHGTNGSNGAAGHAGTHPPTGSQTGARTCFQQNADCCTLIGHACGTCPPPLATSCGTDGTAGCSSEGSQGGGAGVGGGSAIGVFIWGATVTLGATITTGPGGAGGNGGSAGAVSPGAPGNPGEGATTDVTTSCVSRGIVGPCDETKATGAAGSAGGNGGAGGMGGAGGGGAGGDSLCYVWQQGGPAPLTAGLVCNAGPGGAGGTGGNPGPTGRSGASFASP